MTPADSRQLVGRKTGKPLPLKPLIKFVRELLNPVESADYRAWRQQFMSDRLNLVLWIALPCFLTFAALNVQQFFVDPQQITKIVDKLFGDPNLLERYRVLIVVTNVLVGVLLLVCIALQKSRWGKRNPNFIFLFFCWSLNIAPQIVGTLYRLPNPGIDAWLLVFLGQATLIPVYWRLHLLAQLGTIGYYVTVNPLLGLTKIGTISAYNPGTFIYIFWLCLLFDLSVAMYERLKRSEFETQRQLRVFLHSVSHDLKTPVMGTAIVLQSLLKKPSATINVDRGVLERLLEGSDRQLTLINSLLEAHATEVQGITLSCEPLQLSTLIKDVLSDLGPVLAENHVVLDNQVSEHLPLVHADKTQLWRVFNNLISNAMKHNPAGIHLILDAEVIDQTHPSTPAPSPQVPHPTAWLLCKVQDDGIGIEPQQCQRLFDLYARGSRARYMPGLGLGLYLCKQIILAHGGTIGVTSQPGKGSTFWFTLPIVW